MSFLLAGFVGGFLRGAVGLVKYLTSYKNVDIKPWYFLGMVSLSGVVGFISAWVAVDVADIFLDVPRLPLSFALIAGYAGGDFIENIVKISFKQPQLYQIGTKLKALTKIDKK